MAIVCTNWHTQNQIHRVGQILVYHKSIFILTEIVSFVCQNGKCGAFFCKLKRNTHHILVNYLYICFEYIALCSMLVLSHSADHVRPYSTPSKHSFERVMFSSCLYCVSIGLCKFYGYLIQQNNKTESYKWFVVKISK